MMKSLDHQIKVGLFVAIGLVTVSLSILLLGEGQNVFSSTYTLYVRFPHVAGLNQGSSVNLSGLRIGGVSRIDFAVDSTDLILTLDIEEKFRQRLTDQSLATVKTLGALGDKYINIVPGSNPGKVLTDGEFITADRSEDLFDVIAKKGNELSNVVEVVNELNALLKNLNQDGQSAVMMQNLIATSGQLKSLVGEARQSIQQVNSVMTKIDRGEGTLGALINDSTLHNKLLSLTGESPRRQFLKPLIRETINHQERGTKGEK